ncbi:hypothetical protein HDU91_001965 [Kappamyces sp. JEL0680]|nr:hypothetical protein HDU91_001965 [Kappamyces sp. JEL0680]
MDNVWAQTLTGHLANPAPHHMWKSEEQIIKEEEAYIHRPLTPHEKESVHQRLQYLKEHEGHEGAHSEMLMIIIVGLILSQVLIGVWKKYHINSYNLATLLGLWLIPLFMSLSKGVSRFFYIWTIWSIANTYIVKRALESPMRNSTPRLVYYWYQRLYDVCYVVGMVGYFVALAAFFNVPLVLGYDLDGEADVFVEGMTIMFYSVYFGTLGRDFVDRLSDIMATTMGFYSKQGFPRKHLREGTCAICGEITHGSPEKLHRLNCNHMYHELCIRGWTIVGKKDVCP